jgi:lipopolysaccharide transport system permease protein
MGGVTVAQTDGITRFGAKAKPFAEQMTEILAFREVLYFLVWRDTKVRYRQAKLGIYWVVLQPLILMGVYTVIFSSFVKIPDAKYPYALFVLVGLLPWTYFSAAAQDAASSLYLNSSLIGKIYFPRLFIPASRMITILLDFAVMSVLLVIIALIFEIRFTAWILLYPLLALLTFALTAGIGIGMAALTARYWDVRFVMPFLFQVWMFCTPVIYPFSAIPERFRWILVLNPLTGLVSAFRTAFLGEAFNPAQFLYSAICAFVAIAAGVYYFYRTDRKLLEII